mmetsp:Transcript_10692/g.24361  ORF Transcript_10692/g.24361 Transcript_10692/m.24361 type:complete len:422 (-) Transcript_10692:80-1345(-)|eukprot:CAMPEP_0178375986 /NCGR_PEP_ID=MMETSP0689_2-20121128/3171_1 /TAXON_ID=160604 /ORGANISM="Amphidinium massartii, Strain CS-259" /LENGTH=421 /DNA_ID=CAMNT_0019995997 /DNA_START=45 /DNA_END=1310 /DNA_ORIENTATION=+
MRRVELGRASFPLRAFGSATSPLSYGPIGFSGAPAEKGLAAETAKRVTAVLEGLGGSEVDAAALDLETYAGSAPSTTSAGWSPFDRLQPHWQGAGGSAPRSEPGCAARPSVPVGMLQIQGDLFGTGSSELHSLTAVYPVSDSASDYPGRSAIKEEIEQTDGEIEKLRKQIQALQVEVPQRSLPVRDDEDFQVVTLGIPELVDGSMLGIVLNEGVVEAVLHPLAAAAGWKAGDQILRVNGVPVQHPSMPRTATACGFQIESAIVEHHVTRRPIVIDVLRPMSTPPQTLDAPVPTFSHALHVGGPPSAHHPACAHPQARQQPQQHHHYYDAAAGAPPAMLPPPPPAGAHPYAYQPRARQEGRRRHHTRGVPARYGYSWNNLDMMPPAEPPPGANLSWNSFLEPRDKAPAEQVVDVVQSALGLK